MKILHSSLPIDILREGEKTINDLHKIMVAAEPDSNGETRVWYGEPADLFSFGQAIGIIRTANRLL